MGKVAGKHPEKALSALKVKQLSLPGRYADGNGLYLVVDPSGAKRWMLRVTIQGKRSDMGLGSLSLVTLADAREKALEYRRAARQGEDPLAAKRQAKRVYPTFEKAARTVHAEHKLAWKNDKHIQQWINTLSEYAFSIIGEMRIDKIDTPDILRVLSPIWLSKPETARRIRQRIASVFDWAKASGFRDGDNPVEGVTRGLPKQTKQVKHHEALPFAEVPDFLIKLKASNSNLISKLAFELLILTATRTSETILAKPGEFDLKKKVWVVPADRMKTKREHRIPLVDRAVKIIEQAQELSLGGDYLFPGQKRGKPLSNMVFLKILGSMELGVTAHGFRSSFRDWAAESTNHPRDVVEMALAHAIENKVEAAYRRGDLFEKRRELMTEWEKHLSLISLKPPSI
ncbi:integrase arm-type DNA-binding domain-containing protein [Agrobacterium vaccinii]|uniref:tyrosine-type recombinase/integrase n=1 Tax=Agrobacterium vaccinii TaxID=2735528 RepID=UPI001E4614A4|nr:site-specific integrase [Agrobacterium vaccinii]UHS63456.1 integrase arm-type DNA-binding domain-containing protein [Agrobacterium vaccinii]